MNAKAASRSRSIRPNLTKKPRLKGRRLIVKGARSMKHTKPRLFWHSLSLEELAEQQGITPVENLQEVAQLWPVDDDPDELLRFILKERRARRQLPRRRK
jgi:hypothetical protein